MNNFIEKEINKLRQNFINAFGWSTKRRIIVFESDDWGSIRMPSRSAYNKLLRNGINVDKCPYNRFDALASEDDLTLLFETLLKFKDINGSHPIITANTVVANPDFDRIKASNYNEYYYEPFIETLRRYPSHNNSFKIWKQGFNDNIFHPQFHGREHVNVSLWLSLLNNNDVFQDAFELGLWGLGPGIINAGKINIQASFDALNRIELDFHKEAIKKGLKMFEQIFDFRPRSFIANNFTWDPSLNKILKNEKIDIFQGMIKQITPIYSSNRRKLIKHYMGERNDLDQIFLIRNCNFEPSQNNKMDIVGNCIKQIKNAFLWKKPAIISVHRLNFIGYIDENNRTKNNELFKKLLSSILKLWPDVEFLSSDKLGSNIFESKNNV